MRSAFSSIFVLMVVSAGLQLSLLADEKFSNACKKIESFAYSAYDCVKTAVAESSENNPLLNLSDAIAPGALFSSELKPSSLSSLSDSEDTVASDITKTKTH
jgi:hypothetical protein